MKKVLAFCGKLGSGKDYMAMKRVEELNNNGYVIYMISFADPIKQILRDSFGFEKGGKTGEKFPLFTEEYVKNRVVMNVSSLLYDNTEKSRDSDINREHMLCIIDEVSLNYDKNGGKEFYANVVGANNGYIEYPIAFRKLGQLLGTELARYISDSIWIDTTFRKISQVFEDDLADYAIITDCRFLNEYTRIKGFSSSTKWESEVYGVVACDETRARRRKLTIEELISQDQHGSEREVDSIIGQLKPEFVIHNEG